MKILFEDFNRDRFLPLSYTRPLSQFRVGITTLEEKWLSYFPFDYGWKTADYLQVKFPSVSDSDLLVINALVIPNENLIAVVKNLKKDHGLQKDGVIIAYKGNPVFEEYTEEILSINAIWEIFQKNGEVIKQDFQRLTKGRVSKILPKHVTIIGEGEVFLEEGASVLASSLNTSAGPIYIGKNAEVMEGSVIRGPFSLCEGATLKMASKIYGDTTIGPHCKVGGEVSNSVFFSYSNKGHDGFLGNSILGEWCNLGADTNSSNLKNNYSPVKVWSYESNRMENTGLQFCGLIMGDHSKTGINTMLNTGTVVGVCANIFGGGFPDKFIPSFTWGGADGFVEFRMDKAEELATKMMARRKVDFKDSDKEIFESILKLSSSYRMS
jgi:UDP-N-acetylglucosamine diphosphorylase/glucosamine-1-phosphate N-acetyltransferase